MDAGYHKQNPNRLLEPFAWIDTLITSTEWDNFLWLRDHHAAEPHLQDLARLVKQAMDKAYIHVLDEGEWHMPYISAEDRREVENRCSYVPPSPVDQQMMQKTQTEYFCIPFHCIKQLPARRTTNVKCAKVAKDGFYCEQVYIGALRITVTVTVNILQYWSLLT